MSETFKPLLTATDWNNEWMSLQQARQHFDDPTMWDKRAKTFPCKHGTQTPYVSRFLALADVKPGETVLDMGCGTGALAIPLAKEGHKVVACDFSSGMLAMLKEEEAATGATGITSIQMSWADDWAKCGVGKRSVDVALASRSIATDNLKSALLKLSGAARRRACITLPCGPSPKVGKELLQAAGITTVVGQDFVYAVNILIDCGFFPEISYIPSTRIDHFEKPEDALKKYSENVIHAVQGIVSKEELDAIPEHLQAWLDENLIKVGSEYELKTPYHVMWAFIAWETCGL